MADEIFTPSPERPCVCLCHVVKKGQENWLPKECMECAVGRHKPSRPGPTSVSTITEYGLTQRLSFTVKCF